MLKCLGCGKKEQSLEDGEEDEKGTNPTTPSSDSKT